MLTYCCKNISNRNFLQRFYNPLKQGSDILDRLSLFLRFSDLTDDRGLFPLGV